MSYQSGIMKSPDASGGSENINSLLTDQEGEEGLNMLGVDLLYQMDIEDITALRKHFFPDDASPQWFHDNPQGLSLTKEEFIRAMESVAGSSVLSLCAAKLFDTLDIDNSGLLQWEEVLDAIIEKTGTGRQEIGAWTPIDPTVSIYCATHSRGEPIIKIVPLETESTFCYAVISKHGKVGVYDGEFNLLDSYRLGLKADEEAARDFNEFDAGETEEPHRGRSTSIYLTDATFIADNYALLFAASDRSLYLYDATGLVHVPLCHIMGMPNVPLCLDYHSSTDIDKPSLLFVGDDLGSVIVLRFHQPRNSLFKKKHPDKLDNFYWVELANQSEYVTYKVHKKVHSDVLRQISYSADNDMISSCSGDPIRTLVIRHIEDKREPYIFKVPRGVKCFHLDRALHILVTGSSDHVVRIWNPVVTQIPLVSLYGHKTPVVDVRILRNMASIVSLEASAILKVWDVRDEYCIMTLPINYPCLKVPGKKIEYGARAIFPGPSRLQQTVQDNQSSKEQGATAARTSISGSNIDEIETQMSALNTSVCKDTEWQRDSFVVACCNYVAILRLSTCYTDLCINGEGQADILPPPTKEHYGSASSPYRPGEPSRTPRDSVGSKSTSDSSSGSLSLPGQDGPGAGAVKDLNARRTQHRIKQEQMHMLVEQGAPHLALDLHALQPIRFSRPLPITRRMREKGIDVSDPERLLKARIRRDSTPRSQALQSGASSIKSSRTSKSAPTRKHPTASKGRLTPNWFLTGIKSRGGSLSDCSTGEKG